MENSTEYSDFLAKKAICSDPSGFSVDVEELNPMLFDWQRVIVRWAIYKGRAALFQDCGLGKTPEQLEWAWQVHKKTGGNVLILAPLAVSIQTQREGIKFGIPVNVCKSQPDAKPGINITNYERLHRFDACSFVGVVLDESSILKSYTGKVRNQIISSFLNTPYKLACTATPAPNDYTELGNTSEFLGVMTRSEMLAMFFINDAGDTGQWRLKGHVKDNIFWRWISSWAIVMRKPSDIGYDDDKFKLPPLKIHEHVIRYKGSVNGTLFVDEAKTLTERRDARRESMPERVSVAADLANSDDNVWLLWCNLNAESEMLSKKIIQAVEVRGSDNPAHKENSMLNFSDNKIKCLVTKPKIAGFGMNWQNCNHVAFVGLSDSYEQFYQAIRRCWRFGQTKTVHAHIITGEREGAVVANIKRKEKDMDDLFSGILTNMRDLLKTELHQTKKNSTEYNPKVKMELPSWIS